MTKVLFVLDAIVLAAFGLLLFLAPATGLAQFNMTQRVQEVFMARAMGVTLVILGLMFWFAKESDEGQQKSYAMVALVGSVLALVVTVMGMAADGPVKGYGWLAVVLEVAFALAYAFALFIQPRMK